MVVFLGGLDLRLGGVCQDATARKSIFDVAPTLHILTFVFNMYYHYYVNLVIFVANTDNVVVAVAAGVGPNLMYPSPQWWFNFIIYRCVFPYHLWQIMPSVVNSTLPEDYRLNTTDPYVDIVDPVIQDGRVKVQPPPGTFSYIKTDQRVPEEGEPA